MDAFEGRVAIVTGGASGLGFAIAGRLGAEGARVVLVDVEAPALERAQAELAERGMDVRAHRADVSDPEAVEALAERVFGELGTVHLLVNNAGVGGVRAQPLWQKPLEEWRWILGVNLFGVVHGVRSFVPRMLERGEPGHVVNTASVAGVSFAGGIYAASKHAVVSLSESLYRQLRTAGAPIGVSVLCPGLVRTQIWNASRNVPEDLAAVTADLDTPTDREWRRRLEQVVETEGVAPESVADALLGAIRDERLYVVVAPESLRDGMRRRFERIAEQWTVLD